VVNGVVNLQLLIYITLQSVMHQDVKIPYSRSALSSQDQLNASQDVYCLQSTV